MQIRTRRVVVTSLAGLALVTGVAGCAAPGNSEGDGGSSASPSSSATPSAASSPAADANAGFTDGDYTATGSYVSPGGEETVTVKLTLADDVVETLEVTASGTTPNGRLYQKQFIDGIQAEVVGKKIDELSVSKVAGSSLTSGGFNDAIAQIEADAQ